jgi:hypothetical protein
LQLGSGNLTGAFVSAVIQNQTNFQIRNQNLFMSVTSFLLSNQRKLAVICKTQLEVIAKTSPLFEISRLPVSRYF